MSEEKPIMNTPTTPGVYDCTDAYGRGKECVDVRLCTCDGQLRIEGGIGPWVGCFQGTWEKIGE